MRPASLRREGAMSRTRDGVEYRDEDLDGEAVCLYDRRLDGAGANGEVSKIIDENGRVLRTIFVAW